MANIPVNNIIATLMTERVKRIGQLKTEKQEKQHKLNLHDMYTHIHVYISGLDPSRTSPETIKSQRL